MDEPAWVSQIDVFVNSHYHEDVAPGINKQLDFQTALTEIGRILAREQGWYEQRQAVQTEFIGLVGLLGLVSIACLGLIMQRMPAATRAAMGGGVLLVAFVAIRAASFHTSTA